MKKFLQQRWPWFCLGLICLPLINFCRGLLRPVSPKAMMPFESVREETTRTFRFDADYGYTLRSQASREQFLAFVKKMKMEGFRVGENAYVKMTEDKRLQTKITYLDGWIIYEEFYT